MDTSPTPVTPIKQAMVRIAGYEVLSICMANGSVAAGLRMICGLLSVDYPTQLRKLQADPDFRDCLILAKVEIAGQQRVVWFIIAESIPLWLKGIHPSKVALEARETLEEFRSVAVQTLRAFFFPETREQPKAAPPKPEQPTPTLPPPDVTSVSVFDLLRAIAKHTEMAANLLEQQYRETEARQARMDRQHDGEAAWKAEMQHQMQLQREATEVLWSVVLGNASAPEEALSVDQQQAIQLLLHHQHKITGQPRAALEHELLLLVGVAEFRHLQQGDWKKMMAWFRQRLEW